VAAAIDSANRASRTVRGGEGMGSLSGVRQVLLVNRSQITSTKALTLGQSCR
jgi:hypothetical protein